MAKKVHSVSVRSFAKMLEEKDKEFGETFTKDLNQNSLANIAKQKLDLLFGKEIGQT